MKVKQQTLKGFECDIDNAEAFIEYYSKNAPLMQGHLLILKGSVSTAVTAFLKEHNAAYVDATETTLLTRKKRTAAVVEEPPVTTGTAEEKKSIDTRPNTVFYRTIRSGEAIDSDEDIVFFGRINSGAVIESSGSIQVFGIIDGLVRSDGEYMLLKEIGKGTVIFHGEELEKSQFDGQLKLIQYQDGIVIKEILG